MTAWAQDIPGALPDQPHASAPADAAEMATRLAGLTADLEGYQLRGAPTPWTEDAAASRVLTLAGALERYEPVWGVSAELDLPQGLPTSAIHVLCLADPLQAFGVFASLQVSDGVPVSMGEDAHWAHDRLLIWQGRYVVVIWADAPRARVEAQVLALAQAVSAQLPLPDRKPLLVRLMPVARMERLTLVCWPRQVPDVPVLSRALSAQYLGEVGAARLILADMGDQAAARVAYRQMLRDLGDTSLHWPLPALGAENAVIPGEAQTMAMLMQEGPYVVAVLEVTDRLLAEALLRITLTHIRTVQP